MSNPYFFMKLYNSLIYLLFKKIYHIMIFNTANRNLCKLLDMVLNVKPIWITVVYCAQMDLYYRIFWVWKCQSVWPACLDMYFFCNWTFSCRSSGVVIDPSRSLWNVTNRLFVDREKVLYHPIILHIFSILPCLMKLFPHDQRLKNTSDGKIGARKRKFSNLKQISSDCRNVAYLCLLRLIICKIGLLIAVNLPSVNMLESLLCSYNDQI